MELFAPEYFFHLSLTVSILGMTIWKLIENKKKA